MLISNKNPVSFKTAFIWPAFSSRGDIPVFVAMHCTHAAWFCLFSEIEEEDKADEEKLDSKELKVNGIEEETEPATVEETIEENQPSVEEEVGSLTQYCDGFVFWRIHSTLSLFWKMICKSMQIVFNYNE